MAPNSRKRTFELINKDLFCPWYFNSLQPREWNLDDFDIASTKRAKVNKFICHSHLSSDLNILQNSFPDDNDIINHIAKLRKELKKSNNEKGSNYLFWLKKCLEEEKEISEAKIANAEREVVVEKLKFKAKLITEVGDSSASYSIKDREVDDNGEDIIQETEVENNNNNNDTYIINTIKNEAIIIHSKLMLNKSLTDREMKMMSNGLSSILDLNDCSVNSQRSLFDNDQVWEDIKTAYLKKHVINISGIPSSLQSSWKIIIGSIRKSGDLNKGLRYINNIYYGVADEDQYILDIFSHFIKLIKHYPEYLAKQTGLEILENDYIRILWSPLFETLFINHKSIRIICSESCNKYSTSSKSSLYNEAEKVIGFKIDVRIVFNYRGTDYDLVCGEAACHTRDKKIIKDEGKLTREGKDIQDLLVGMNCDGNFPWLIQLIGHSMDFSTIHLSSPGLYVNIPRFSSSLPSTISELDTDVPTLLCNLLTFRSYVIDATEKLKCNLREKMNSVSSLGRMNNDNSISEMQYWIRPTYYTPPNNHLSKIPSNLNYITPPSNIIDKLMKSSYLCGDEHTSGLNIHDICEFGWFKKGDRFFNVYSKQYSDKHECCE